VIRFGIFPICFVLIAGGCSTADDRQGLADAEENWFVTKVSDGDTIWVESQNGQRQKIRFIGIDTPENGKCGFSEASDFVANLVFGRQVALLRGGTEDQDHFKRFLRYVEVDGRDVGLLLLEEGLAIARYDSRDGYDLHDREDLYISADLESPNRCPDSAWDRT
jgi:endonuclease YncB( thermonuclease family)